MRLIKPMLSALRIGVSVNVCYGLKLHLLLLSQFSITFYKVIEKVSIVAHSGIYIYFKQYYVNAIVFSLSLSTDFEYPLCKTMLSGKESHRVRLSSQQITFVICCLVHLLFVLLFFSIFILIIRKIFTL